MTNKLSSTNIAELLEEHLKSLNDINQVIVKSNVDANVINNINSIIKPISESVKALNIITNSLSQMMFMSVKSSIQYKYGIKTIIKTVTTIFEALNEFEINEDVLYKFQKSFKPLSNLIKSLNEISLMLNTMQISSGIKLKFKIKAILNNVRYITENISGIYIDDEANKKFNKISGIVKSLSDISKNLLMIGATSILVSGLKTPILNTVELLKEISDKITEQLKDVKIYVNAERSIERLKVIIANIKDTTKDLIIIALFSPILVGLSKPIKKTIKLMVDLCNELVNIDKNAAKAASNAAIIGKALGEFAKGILIFVVASLGGIIFIAGIIALLAMKVFMTVLFWLFSEEQMERMANSIAVINSMSKTMLMLTGMILLWALVGMLIGSAWMYILKTVMFVVIAILVFTLLGFLSKYIDDGNKTMFAIAGTLVILSLTVVIWALTGELITEEMSNIWNVILFVGIAIGGFLLLSLFDRFIKGGSKIMLVIAATLIILSLTVVIWALTGELITEEMSNIWNVLIFVGVAIGCFIALGFIGKYLNEGGKNLVMIALSLILISLTVWIWVEIGQKVMDNWLQILVVSGFVLVCVALLWALSLIKGELMKGTIALVIMAVGLALLSVVTLLMIHVGKQIIENWAGLLAISVFMVVMVGIFAVIGIPAVFGFVSLGAVAMILIGAALLVFSVSVLILVNAIKKLEWEDIPKIMALIGGLGAAVAAIGLIMPAIVLGSIALGLLGAALIIFMIPILLFVATLKMFKSIKATDEDIKKPIQMMGTLISEINNVFGNDALIAIPLAAAKVMALVPVVLAVGIIAETLQNLANLSIATAFNNEGKPIKFTKMKAADFATAGQNAIGMIKIMASIFGEQTKTVKILGKDISIIPLTESELNGITGKSKKKIKQLSQITGFIGNIAETLQNVASLKIPTEFNNEGKPIKFRRMWSKDFIDAAKNSATMVKIMAAIFGDTPQAFEMADLKFRITPLSEAELEGIRGKSKRKMRKLSKITSYVGIICNTIGSLAALTFPTQFNEEGQATSYEKITEAQLVNASVNAMGMVKLLSSLFGDKSEKIKLGGTEIVTMPIGEAALENLKNSAKRKMKRLAKITGYIGTITNTLGAISLLNIPVEYDEDGNATKFEKITETQLINASVNAIGIVKMLAGLFGDKATKVTISGKAINVIPLSESEIDGVSGQAKRKMKKLTKITKHISTITTILGSIAALRVPTSYDEEGNPKTFEQITQDQLVNSSANVCGIIKLLTGLFGDSTTTVKINGKSITVQNIAGNELDAIGISAALKMATLTNITESVSKSIKKIADLGNIETPNSVALNSILNFIKNSVVTIAGIDFSKLIGPSDSQKLVVLDKVLNSIGSLDVKKIIESFKSVQDTDVSNLSAAGDKLKTYMTELIKVYGSLNQQSFREVPGLNNFVNFSNSFSKFGDIDASKIETLQTKLANLFSTLNQISTTNANNLNSFLTNLEAKISSLKEAIDGLNRSITNFNSNPVTSGSNSSGSNPSGNATRSTTTRGSNSEPNTSGKTLNDIYNCVDAIEWLLDDIRRNTLTSSKVDY